MFSPISFLCRAWGVFPVRTIIGDSWSVSVEVIAYLLLPLLLVIALEKTTKLNIQPVLPFTVGDWNIISRTIAPLIALPSLTGGALGDAIAGAPSSNDPFGDINQTFYFSPAAATDFIWGGGPSVTLPTATQT